MILTFNDFPKKYNLKNRATSNKKIYEVLKNIGIDMKFGVYLRNVSCLGDIGIVKLHPSICTHWVCYIKENYFHSYFCAPPKKLSKFIIKRNGYCLYSEHQIQKNDSFCASFCLYKFYLTKVLGIDFESAVLNLYCQRIS